jgi:hypothetical protein
MAVSTKQRQKKLEKKNKKRKLAKKAASSLVKVAQTSVGYAKYPILECLVPDTLFDLGIGAVVVTRVKPNGEVGVSSFVVDVFCLGVKDAFFTVTDQYDYESRVRPMLTRESDGTPYSKVEPAYARKLVEGAVAYTNTFEISPHKDYHQAKGIFGDINVADCEETIEFGQDGVPCYMQGPHESAEQAQRIFAKVAKHFGATAVPQHIFDEDDFDEGEGLVIEGEFR